MPQHSSRSGGFESLNYRSRRTIAVARQEAVSGGFWCLLVAERAATVVSMHLSDAGKPSTAVFSYLSGAGKSSTAVFSYLSGAEKPATAVSRHLSVAVRPSMAVFAYLSNAVMPSVAAESRASEQEMQFARIGGKNGAEGQCFLLRVWWLVWCGCADDNENTIRQWGGVRLSVFVLVLIHSAWK